MLRNRFTSKDALCMFWTVRLLTFVAFTAHAVLGCCFSHGNCLPEQTIVLSVQDCVDNNDLCSSHGDQRLHWHQEQSTALSVVDASSCVSCPAGGHDHTRHCDDSSCVFGVVETTTLFDLQLLSDVIWGGATLDSWLLVSQDFAFVSEPQAGPPNAHLVRAVLQVWII